MSVNEIHTRNGSASPATSFDLSKGEQPLLWT